MTTISWKLLSELNSRALNLSIFFLPFFQKATVILIVILFIVSILNNEFGKISISFLGNVLLIAPVIFFALHLAGLIYSKNQIYGWHDIETKLSFLFLPVLFAGMKITREQFNQLKKYFIAGCFLSSLICLSHAGYFYIKDGSPGHFFYSEYSVFLHPTYFAIYLNLAIIFLLEFFFGSKAINKFLILALIAFFGLSIILLSARVAILVSIFSVAGFFVYQIYRAGKFRPEYWILLSVILFAVIFQVYFIKGHNRFSQVADFFKKEKSIIQAIKNHALKEVEYESVTMHIAFWQNALEVVSRNPVFGVGTGDLKEALVENYRKNNFQIGVKGRYSPHNQYLHTSVILGLMGLIVLLLLLFIPLIKSVRKGNTVFVLFLSIILLNCFTESLLEVQSGILFFTLFYCLFATSEREEKA